MKDWCNLSEMDGFTLSAVILDLSEDGVSYRCSELFLHASHMKCTTLIRSSRLWHKMKAELEHNLFVDAFDFI